MPQPVRWLAAAAGEQLTQEWEARRRRRRRSHHNQQQSGAGHDAHDWVCPIASLDELLVYRGSKQGARVCTSSSPLLRAFVGKRYRKQLDHTQDARKSGLCVFRSRQASIFCMT